MTWNIIISKLNNKNNTPLWVLFPVSKIKTLFMPFKSKWIYVKIPHLKVYMSNFNIQKKKKKKKNTTRVINEIIIWHNLYDKKKKKHFIVIKLSNGINLINADIEMKGQD